MIQCVAHQLPVGFKAHFLQQSGSISANRRYAEFKLAGDFLDAFSQGNPPQHFHLAARQLFMRSNTSLLAKGFRELLRDCRSNKFFATQNLADSGCNFVGWPGLVYKAESPNPKHLKGKLLFRMTAQDQNGKLGS